MSATAFFIEEEKMASILQEIAGNLDHAQGEAGLDFSSVRRISSDALRALEDLNRVADAKAVKVVLRGVNVDLYKVLKLLKLTQRFSFVS